SSFLLRMLCRFVIRRRRFDVLPRLSCCYHHPAAGMGRALSSHPLRTDVLLQFLVSLSRSKRRSSMESRELQRAGGKVRLSRDASSFHVDRGEGHVLCLSSSLSLGLLPVLPRRHTQRTFL